MSLFHFERECRGVLARVDVIPCDEKNRSLVPRCHLRRGEISICENAPAYMGTVRVIDAGLFPVNLTNMRNFFLDKLGGDYAHDEAAGRSSALSLGPGFLDMDTV
jgi:hypothetical protein